MIEYAGQEGGRYTYIDDILNLQNLALAFNSIFSGCDNFIISGCEVSGTTISEGYVYINNKIRYFAGAKNISTFPIYIYEWNSVQNVTYANDANKVGRVIYSCSIDTKIPSTNDVVTNKVPQGIEVTATSGLRLNDAFFGKYALMTNSPRTIQSIEKDVAFNGAVALKSGVTINGNWQLISGSSVFSVNYDSSGNLTMQSQLSGKSASKIVINSTGEFRFYIGSALCATIDNTGVTLSSNKNTANLVQGGNIVISGSDIYNQGVASDSGVVNVNYIGYSDSTLYYRDFNVYDGKNNLIFKIDGAKKEATINGALLLAGNNNGILLKNTTFAKTSKELLNLISWQDKNNENIAYIGYDSTSNSSFRIKNSIGNIEIHPAEYLNVVGKIYENGISLEQKYLTTTDVNSVFAKKANIDDVYSKTSIDNKFVSLDGGVTAILNYMKSKGDADAEGTVRGLLKVSSINDANELYVSKNKYLADIATDADKKRLICENIGAAYGDDVQKKLKDTGWVYCDGNGTFLTKARQIGNIVYITGLINTLPKDSEVFVLPNSIDAPVNSVYCSWTLSNGKVWTGYLDTLTRKFIAYASEDCPQVRQGISITYMV